MDTNLHIQQKLNFDPNYQLGLKQVTLTLWGNVHQLWLTDTQCCSCVCVFQKMSLVNFWGDALSCLNNCHETGMKHFPGNDGILIITLSTVAYLAFAIWTNDLFIKKKSKGKYSALYLYTDPCCMLDKLIQ